MTMHALTAGDEDRKGLRFRGERCHLTQGAAGVAVPGPEVAKGIGCGEGCGRGLDEAYVGKAEASGERLLIGKGFREELSRIEEQDWDEAIKLSRQVQRDRSLGAKGGQYGDGPGPARTRSGADR